MQSDNGLTEEEQLQNEMAYFLSDEYDEFENGLNVCLDGAYVSSNPNVAATAFSIGLVSQDEQNIVARARRMLNIEWTPLYNVTAFGCDDPAYVRENTLFASRVTATDGTVTYGYFAAGKTYRGVPYAQPVYSGKYVGWAISLADFEAEVTDPDSSLYSKQSYFTKRGPYFGNDCSAFVSWCWGLEARQSCMRLSVYDSVYIGKDISILRVGDCLDNPDLHVALVTNIGYDVDGNVVSIELTEQTTCQMRTICYGELIPGESYSYHASLAYFVQHYLQSGYSIYRRNTPTAVPDADYDISAGDPEPVRAAKSLQNGILIDPMRLLREAVGLE